MATRVVSDELSASWAGRWWWRTGSALRECLEISAIENRLIELERRAGQNTGQPNLIAHTGNRARSVPS